MTRRNDQSVFGLAEELGVSPSTVYRLRDQKEIKAYRIGRHLRFRRESIERFKDRHAEQGEVA